MRLSEAVGIAAENDGEGCNNNDDNTSDETSSSDAAGSGNRDAVDA